MAIPESPISVSCIGPATHSPSGRPPSIPLTAPVAFSSSNHGGHSGDPGWTNLNPRSAVSRSTESTSSRRARSPIGDSLRRSWSQSASGPSRSTFTDQRSWPASSTHASAISARECLSLMRPPPAPRRDAWPAPYARATPWADRRRPDRPASSSVARPCRPLAPQPRPADLTIRAPPRPRKTPGLSLARFGHSGRDVRGGLALRLSLEQRPRQRPDVVVQVDPVEDRPRDPRLVAAHDIGTACALPRRDPVTTARARVRRQDELEPGGVPHLGAGPADMDRASLERRPQCLDEARRELRGFIEEQNSKVGQRKGSRLARLRTTTDQRDQGCRVVGCGERRSPDQP